MRRGWNIYFSGKRRWNIYILGQAAMKYWYLKKGGGEILKYWGRRWWKIDLLGQAVLKYWCVETGNVEILICWIRPRWNIYMLRFVSFIRCVQPRKGSLCVVDYISGAGWLSLQRAMLKKCSVANAIMNTYVALINIESAMTVID